MNRIGIFACLTLLAGCHEGSHMNQAIGFQRIIAHAEVTRVEVLHAPDPLQTRAALPPASLERYATAIYDTTDTKKIAALLEALKQTPMTPDGAAPDVRWGILLKGRDNRQSATFYLDKFGKRAIAQGKNVQLSGDAIITVLQQQFLPKI